MSRFDKLRTVKSQQKKITYYDFLSFTLYVYHISNWPFCFVYLRATETNLFYSGNCFNTLLDWNYYLKKNDGMITYEGYINQKWTKVGENWTTSERLALGRTDALIEMNPANNHKKYPVSRCFCWRCIWSNWVSFIVIFPFHEEYNKHFDL